MHPTVVLFDIDGTLLTTGGAGRRALEMAFDALFGHPEACQGFSLSGMTDRSIVRQGLSAIGQDSDDAAIDRVLQAYLKNLEGTVAAVDAASYVVHRGAREAVALALSQRHVAVGLGTGNVRTGARIKLERVGLFSSFGFGGFGCDHEDRTELIRRGAERGAERLKLPLHECNVLVIGDTPKDVSAAKGIGARCLGVGTGRFTPQALVEAGADRAFDDLSSPGAIEALMSLSA